MTNPKNVKGPGEDAKFDLALDDILRWEVINEPITMKSFRSAVDDFKKLESDFNVHLSIYRTRVPGRGKAKDKITWQVSRVMVNPPRSDGLVLVATAPRNRPTPFITKAHGQKTWHSLDTLISQFTDIFCPSQRIFVTITETDPPEQPLDGEST